MTASRFSLRPPSWPLPTHSIVSPPFVYSFTFSMKTICMRGLM